MSALREVCDSNAALESALLVEHQRRVAAEERASFLASGGVVAVLEAMPVYANAALRIQRQWRGELGRKRFLARCTSVLDELDELDSGRSGQGGAGPAADAGASESAGGGSAVPHPAGAGGRIAADAAQSVFGGEGVPSMMAAGAAAARPHVPRRAKGGPLWDGEVFSTPAVAALMARVRELAGRLTASEAVVRRQAAELQGLRADNEGLRQANAALGLVPQLQGALDTAREDLRKAASTGTGGGGAGHGGVGALLEEVASELAFAEDLKEIVNSQSAGMTTSGR